ncbi:MAG: M20/M25/M40 family metallo-hydrolase [Candidatus Omnitrophica bacterium]|nr:M20/M25/M40 family metallo-hydrolase [Candidatus Omnitrophota bacterium]
MGNRRRSKDIEKVPTQLVERLKGHVYKLSHEIGDRSAFNIKNLNEAANYITEQFKSFGYDVEFQEYDVSGGTVKNIIVTKEGIEKPNEVVILGAHYDTCFNPGADDNASAVAGLLESARFFSDRKTNRTIKFIAFVNEEPPFFKTEDMGSRIYAKQARKKKEDIKAVLILEMIGYYTDKPRSQQYPLFFGFVYPNKGNFIMIVSNWHSRSLAGKIVSSFKEKSQFPIESIVAPAALCGVDFSDHWSFWKEGYPAVMITDTGFYRNPNYHSELDTYETLDYESTTEVVKGLGAVLIELAE